MAPHFMADADSGAADSLGLDWSETRPHGYRAADRSGRPGAGLIPSAPRATPCGARWIVRAIP